MQRLLYQTSSSIESTERSPCGVSYVNLLQRRCNNSPPWYPDTPEFLQRDYHTSSHHRILVWNHKSNVHTRAGHICSSYTAHNFSSFPVDHSPLLPSHLIDQWLHINGSNLPSILGSPITSAAQTQFWIHYETTSDSIYVRISRWSFTRYSSIPICSRPPNIRIPAQIKASTLQ